MIRYLLNRLYASLLVVVGVLTIAFIVVRLSGDPAALLAGQGASADDIAAIRRALGLDQPLPAQYFSFMVDAVQGDFGTSLRFRRPAMSVVMQAAPITIQLTGLALAILVVFAIPAGIVAAMQRGRTADKLTLFVSSLTQSLPSFWLGILLVLVFAVWLGWFPSRGWGELNRMVLPAITLAAYSMGRVSRLMRSAMLEVLSQDYIRTARAKGLYSRRIVLRHAFPNACIPVSTLLGLEVGVLLGGAVITETIFAVPGLGRLAVSAALARDYALVQAAAFVAAVMVITVNLIVDILYLYLDPRIRLEN